MAINLKSLEAPSKRPFIGTIVADGGMGKTSLAAEFPAPVFIRTEDGTKSIAHRKDVALFPVAETSDQVFEAIAALCTEEHKLQTLVIDSITKLNAMIEAEIVKSDKRARGINQAFGGYGNGPDAASMVHWRLREAIEYLRITKKMHVVFIAHATIETIDPPDDDSYTRYSLRMHKKCLAPYTDDVDLVGFLKLTTYVVGNSDDPKSKKRIATTDGTRVITCYPVPSHVSKNRLNITEDIQYTLGANPFATYL